MNSPYISNFPWMHHRCDAVQTSFCLSPVLWSPDCVVITTDALMGALGLCENILSAQRSGGTLYELILWKWFLCVRALLLFASRVNALHSRSVMTAGVARWSNTKDRRREGRKIAGYKWNWVILVCYMKKHDIFWKLKILLSPSLAYSLRSISSKRCSAKLRSGLSVNLSSFFF